MPHPAVLQRFSEPTRTWFASVFTAPTPAQVSAWEAICQGRHTLVIAPTGSGKTLAAFLWAIDTFQTRPSSGSTRVLYVSPLKALGVDVERNLRAPLTGIAHAAGQAGIGAVPSVGVRSGDTTPQQRRALIAQPPDVLITTPESLYLLLTSQAARTLTDVETVIVDEIHALAGTKRGAHLAVSLERLDALLPRPAQRIGLSATVDPPEEVARFLGGTQAVTIVRPPAEKSWELTIRVPVPDLTSLPSLDRDAEAPERPGSVWPFIEAQVLDLVLANTSTLVFANSRRAAERLTARLNELHAERMGESVERVHAPAAQITTGDTHGAAPDLARAHHGSVSKQQRAQIEDDLKSGRLRCVVATSSLELGIDMGAVDLVVQVEAPPSVASGLQRVGRAGHQVGAASRGALFPTRRSDVLACAITAQRMREGRIEPLAIPANPLDILAQQTVAAASVATLDVEEWFDTLRRCAPFATLPRSAFDATLDLLAGRYPSSQFAELRPRIVWDRDAGTITGRPGAQRLAVTSGGTIPDRGLFGVYLTGEGDGRRVGELDEEMVYESRIGDVFALGATSWRIEDITHDRVLVSPAFGQPARLPFWIGDSLGRPIELGRALGAFQRRLAGSSPATAEAMLAEIGLDANARANVLAYLADQAAATGVVPSDTELVIERFTDELGDWRVVLHSPFGLAVHAPWALAVGARLRERYGIDGAVMAANDGIVARVPMIDDDPPGAELFAFDPDELAETVTAEVGGSALFASRFRECAARALLLPRRDPGRRSPLWQQRLRASQLLDIARDYPQFPIILETVRECLQDVYDLPALRRVSAEVTGRRIRLVEVTTPAPSPFATTMLFGYVAQYMYERDTPLAERRAAALSLDVDLLAELLGRADLRELLDAGVIAATEAELQHLSPARRLRGADGAADLLRLLGPLTAAELSARLADDADPEALVRAGRAIAVAVAGRRCFAAAEDASRLRDGLGVPLPPGLPAAFTEPVADPLGDLVGRYGATHGPFTAAEVAHRLGLPVAVAAQTLERLASARRVIAGEFTPGVVDQQWCDAQVLRRLRQRSLAALRAQIEPVEQGALGRFLPAWQQVGAGLRGVDGLAYALEQLAGVAAPASAWESLILPARVSDYSPAMLDELLTTGEFLAAGVGQISATDGWVSFHLTQDAPLTLCRGEFDPTPAQRDLLERLGGGGLFLRDLAAGLASSPMADLWALFWAGRITNDTFAPLRGLLGASSTHRRSPTPRARAARLGRLRPSAGLAPGGRWGLLPTPEEGTAAAHARAEYLLDRHGVVTRGAVAAEQVPGGFAATYRVLAQMEERGLCRRGYFVEGLGAAQFGAPATIDLLRTHAGEPSGTSAVTLAATDPANPYGAALDWPTTSGHRPGRKAGGLVVLVNGALVLYLERGGKTVLQFCHDPAHLAAAAASLVGALQRARVPKLAVETVNGDPILGTPLAAALLDAGFYASPRAVRFRS
ncbi:MAG: ATP-dependent helicase [Propionibacteriaceae bacterium]|nr:ATP-dependent helicase [Propionibacteriaceae bacterium]